MPATTDFPILDSPAKCAALWPEYPEKVVGMWATRLPQQNIDVLWRLREELLKLGVPVVFFFNESAKPMLANLTAEDPNTYSLSNPANQHIYQLNDARFFRLLNFVEVLVSNDWFLGYRQSLFIKAKLVSMVHRANMPMPHFGSYFYDYAVSDVAHTANFDYSIFPDRLKIHRNSSFTQLVTGHPKIDLNAEERRKNALGHSIPVLLIYPLGVSLACSLQAISPDKYEEIWSDVISAFLAWSPTGIVVYRPRSVIHPVEERLQASFAGSGRFILDADDDNKFWLARARYFITDCSRAFVNFCLTAKRPAIRLLYSPEMVAPSQDEWGWTISRPVQLIPLLEQMDREETHWTRALAEKQKRDCPTLGQNFALLAGMVKRIFENDDDPAWLRLDKGHTPCETAGEVLRLAAKCTQNGRYALTQLDFWLENVGVSTRALKVEPRIWLLFLRRALLSEPVPDLARAEGNNLALDVPIHIARYTSLWCDNALRTLPMPQVVGLLRHLMQRYPKKVTASMFITITSNRISGPEKKRTLFFLLMELPSYDKETLLEVNTLAEAMPQYFSRPVLDKLNRFLPLAMKVPLSLRRFAACILGLKKPLAKRYWEAHRKLG